VSPRIWVAPTALGVAVACGPTVTGPALSVNPPLNACQGKTCPGYTQTVPTPTCDDGVCLVAAQLYSGLYLMVSLSEDAFFAPGQTFVIQPTPNCGASCAQLPANGVVQGAYLVSPQNQVTLNWDLGNPGASTPLPAHVTYRPLWPPGGSLASAVDADTLNLPLGPIQALVIVDSSPSSPLGPGGGASIGFQANLQPGLYEATIQPDPPFDVAFPPSVKRVTIAAGNQNDDDALALDATTLETGVPGAPTAVIPVFDLVRTGAPFTGWSAYLRDVTTLRRISRLATLGSNTTNVTLPTNHHPPSMSGVPGDALDNAELVIAPPAAEPVPTYHAGLVADELPYKETYVALAAPVTLSGNVTDVDQVTPVETDLFFEAQSIYGADGTLNQENFEYTGLASARIDATGTSTYSLTLPPGIYQLTARPLDSAHQVTVETQFKVAPSTSPQSAALTLDAPRPVQGSIVIADGRPGAAALVEAVPVACSTGTSTLCLPRDVQTTSAADGTFSLALDPGSYTLRVQPPDGTGFPWVTQSLLVGPTAVTVPQVVVPVPLYVGLQLQDPSGNPVVAAVVRAFHVPATGPAVEVGRAITDATGTYVMYLAPTAP
jgi:hypothetical protein